MKYRLIIFAKELLMLCLKMTGINESGSLVTPLIKTNNEDKLEYKLQNIIIFLYVFKGKIK